MKIAIVAFIAMLLSACATPQGVVDTASLVGKLSTQMNAQMVDYVAKQTEIRAFDVQRLTVIQSRTNRLAAANQIDFDIYRLAADVDASRIMQGIKAGRIEEANIGANNPLVRYRQMLAAEFGNNSFDDAPLKSVTETAGTIAKPRSTEEQIRALVIFGQQVYQDIKKTNKQEATASE